MLIQFSDANGNRYVLDVSHSELFFGSNLVGSDALPQTLTLKNVGWADISLPGISVSGSAFSIEGVNPGVLRPGQKIEFEVSFSPTTGGPSTGSIYIDAGVAGTAYVRLYGVGFSTANGNVDITGMRIAELASALATEALLNLENGTKVWVYNDPDLGLNGFYTKNGASGVGSFDGPFAAYSELMSNSRDDIAMIEDVATGAANLNGTGLVPDRLGGNHKTISKLESEYQAIINAQTVQNETATASATLAGTRATAAEAARTGAEDARDIAQAAVGVDYADATAALAGATNGDKFTYWDGDQIVFSTKIGGVLVELAGPLFGADKIGAADGHSSSWFATVQGFISRLLSSVGASMVGFIQDAVGAVSTTIEKKIQRDELSLFDFMDEADVLAVVDGTSTPDLTAELTAAVAAAVLQNKSLHIPGTKTPIKITAPIPVSGPVTIYGDGNSISEVIAIDCDAFTFAAGVSWVNFESINIALAVRYTTTQNGYTAFRINGTAIAPCYHFKFRSVFIDGFQYGVQGDFVSQSIFDIATAYVFSGIWVKGQSVNNVVPSTAQITGVDSIFGASAAGSTGIRVGDGTAPQPEGFTIAPGVLIFGFKRALRNHGAINVSMNNAICDGISEFIVLEQSSDTAPAINNNYSNNYCGMYGACDASFYLSSSATSYRNDNRGTTLFNNEIAIYGGSALNYGFLIEGANIENINVLSTKAIRGSGAGGVEILTTIRDCKITGGRGHRISGNSWNSTTGFETAVAVEYEGNSGRLAVGASLCARAGTLIGSAVYDPPSLADGDGDTSAGITVTGAALGDYVRIAAPYDLQGITATAYVSAADTVKIRLQNETGGTVDLGSGTWRVAVQLVC